MLVRIAAVIAMLAALAVAIVLLLPVSERSRVDASPLGLVSECGPMPDLDDCVEAASGLLRAGMFDPESARIEWPRELVLDNCKCGSAALNAWALTGRVNGKNRLGGYTGNQRFTYWFARGELVAGTDFGSDICQRLPQPLPISALITLARQERSTLK